MISGTIVLENITIDFECVDGIATATIIEQGLKEGATHEYIKCPQYDFLAALAIAVHNDGLPNMDKDYPLAEAIQKKIRWIP